MIDRPVLNKVDFDNTSIAFGGKSDAELRKTYWLFKMINSNFLVKVGPPITNFAMKLHLPITGLIKSTIFNHFCGGETIEDCIKTIAKLNEYKIGTILDYSVEGEKTETGFDACTTEIIQTITRAAEDKAIPFCVFKVTGLARFGLLEKLDANEKLTNSEEEEFSRIKTRVNKICKAAFDVGVPTFIDAEETWVQNTIDALAYEMMELYNKERAIVYNTIQMYRTQGLTLLHDAYQKALSESYFLGIKLVRGAYMEKERARAQKFGYASPIQPNKAATDKDYDEALKFCAHNHTKIALCAGTHNEISSKLLVNLMDENAIESKSQHMYFSQLLGMSDHITYNLANAGYNVAKYVPYGPVRSVLPYLFRRANENTAISGQMSRELSLIIEERKRRKK